MKRILVPTDFSDCAEAATEVAIAVALKTGAEIFFFNITPAPGVAHVPVFAKESHTQDAGLGHIKDELGRLVRKAEMPGVKATPVLAVDRGNERIEDYVAPYRIEMIVMGSHCNGGMRDFIMGSNTLHTIRHAQVPVLVIKKRSDTVSFQHILFASTFNEAPGESFLVIADMAKAWNTPVNLLHVRAPRTGIVDISRSRAYMHSLMTRFPDVTFISDTIESNDELLAVEQFSNQFGADLVSLPAHGWKGSLMRPFFHLAETLVKQTATPVLVIN